MQAAAALTIRVEADIDLVNAECPVLIHAGCRGTANDNITATQRLRQFELVDTLNFGL